MDNDAVPQLEKSNDARVLLLPPTTRDAQAIQKVLAVEGISCVICPSMEILCKEIGHGAGAVCISEEAIIEEADGLVACIKAQPVWSDLGTIVLSRSGTELPRLAGLVPLLGNVTVLERPVRVTTLLSLVRSCLRARKRQYEMRAHLALLDRADHELRSSSERLALAVQTGKLGVWELDLTSKEMHCSDTCKAHHGRRSDQTFTYADLWASIHPEDVQRVRRSVVQAIEQNVEYDTEYRNIWPDGTTHWVLVQGRQSHAEDDKRRRLIGVTLDITERKKAEDLRTSLLDAERSARTEAERASRMKDEFLATLSHELRTPLNAILGWSHILSLGKSNETQLSEGLRTIERNARAQTQIIEDLLDMSRIISGKVRLDVQRVSLANVVQAAVETVRPTADAKGVRIQVVLDPSPVPVSGDPNRLQQVFWNLISNAIKFTPRGGRAQVLLERVNSHLEVSVIDTGQGISPEFLPHVFDRFRQADASTSRQHGGLGLGLAIVKQLVELHGGTVRAKSQGADRGST
ncbi:MAG TPA: ATP-binding protein, partial [Roseimicrobium sp.]|nr:ATP-binding protein [Roseimicrobium sp.]